jgi:hypothetical protein
MVVCREALESNSFSERARGRIPRDSMPVSKDVLAGKVRSKEVVLNSLSGLGFLTALALCSARVSADQKT